MRQKETEAILRIAKKIKQIREEKNITIENFYIDTNIHISRVESGKVNFSINTLIIICNYLEVSLHDFFLGI
jgi:transcriptional regulator with XRE-family HTH domain